MKRWMLTLIIPGLLVSGTALAQQEGPENDDGADRGVARISLLNGDVSVRRGDSGDWVAAAINVPLLAEDRVMTAPGARAEVQLDFFNRIRLAEDTEIRLAQLDDRVYTVQVARGLMTFAALKGSDAQVEIQTPGAALRPLAQGSYRISVDAEGVAEFTVRSGEADIASSRGTQRLRPGRTMQARLVGNDSEYQFIAAVPHDAWDQFNEQRDRELSQAEAATYQHVSQDVYGAEDLNGYGEWVDVAPYGWSWRPYVAAGWTPYRYGRWSWLDYYGWTWVSYDPWGWAPYHYGRWFNAGGRWCWNPGARFGARHYWSPALVAWVGWDSLGGFNAGAGAGWGAVGWVPLAPFEPIHRWWGRGYYGNYRNPANFYNRATYVTNVNVTNVYRNARIANGMTVVTGNDFSRGYVGRPLRPNSVELSRATAARGPVPVAPTRDSLRWSDRQVNSGAIASRAAATSQERFFSRRETPRVSRVPFETQRQALEHVATRGASEAATAEGHGWRRATDANGGASSGTSEWQRFGDPRMSSRSVSESSTGRPVENTNARQSEAHGNTQSGGWQRFGDPGSRTSSGQASGVETGNAFRSTTPAQQPSTPRWSTGGSTARSEQPARAESSRGSENSRWSAGSSRQSSSPRQSEPARSESARPSREVSTPRPEPTRSLAPSSSGSSSSGSSRQASPSRGRGKGNSVDEASNGISGGGSFAGNATGVESGGSFSGNSGSFGREEAHGGSPAMSSGSFSGNSGSFGREASGSSSSSMRSGSFGGGSESSGSSSRSTWSSGSSESRSYSGNSGSFGRSSSPSVGSGSSRSSGGSFGSSSGGARSSGGGGGFSRGGRSGGGSRGGGRGR